MYREPGSWRWLFRMYVQAQREDDNGRMKESGSAGCFIENSSLFASGLQL